jgi:mannose-6-phosphate isomerase-like protein (cupin superfamily)
MSAPNWKNFTLEDVIEQQRQSGLDYFEFLDLPTFSAGLYTLPAGGADRQAPHSRDELYFVVAGEATITVGDASHPVGPGSLIYVRAGMEHRFSAIGERLSVLVFFFPPAGETP